MIEIKDCKDLTQEQLLGMIQSKKKEIDEGLERLKETRKTIEELRKKSDKIYEEFINRIESNVKPSVETKAPSNATKLIQDTVENICDNFCKYQDTCDDNCECEWIRKGNNCPLDALY